MKNIIVFGANSAMASSFLERVTTKGSNLILISKNESKLEIQTNHLKITKGCKCEYITQDLSQLSEHKSLIESLKSKMPQIDLVLFANGTLPNQEDCEKNTDLMLEEFNNNFTSIASISNLIATQLEDNKSGTIAVISSVAGDRGRQSNYIYGAAKGALSTYLEGLRNRLYKSNVHVVTIKPGFVSTPMTSHLEQGPLFVSPELIAKDIEKAINKKKDVIYTPFFWSYIMLIIKSIPESIFKKLSL